MVENEFGKQIKAMRSENERKETTNLDEEVEEEAMLLMMGCSLRDRHKQEEKSARRLSVINQSSSMERSTRRADSSKSLAENVEILDNPKRDLESSVDHKANLVSLVRSSNSLVEQVECLDHSEQVITLKSLARSIGSSVESLASSDNSAWIVDNSHLEQEKQLHVEKDLRVVVEVQDEKWRLGMDDKFCVKKAWKFFDLLKRARPIQRISINGKSATKTIKNPTKGKSVKVKIKSIKEKIKSDKEKIRLRRFEFCLQGLQTIPHAFLDSWHLEGME